jgi:hypothetical protein
MGGNLAWTLRFEDGSTYKMDRWTNALKGNMISASFLSGDPVAVHDALSAWLDMQDDWNSNKDTGNYENNMTPVYAPYPFGIRPSEYGIVVTDFQTKTIISHQGYTSFDSLTVHEWMIDESKRYADSTEDNESYDAELAGLRKLHSEGCFKTVQKIIEDGDNFSTEIIDVSKMGFSEAIQTALSSSGLTRLGYIKIDLPYGWKLVDLSEDMFDNSPDGKQQTYNAIKGLGFKITSEEDADFQKWINGSDEDDE